MKANELMIGNWVYSAFTEHPCQVEGIEWTESGYAFVKISGVDGYKCIESLSPIPLTPEILEKNGFVFMTGLWYLRTGERKPIQIVFEDNNVIRLSINATPVPIGLKYVHQLQHALRLCGIDKTIEL